MWDYDLVVIGGTGAGAIAARQAAERGARVAWVWQGESVESVPPLAGLLWATRHQEQAHTWQTLGEEPGKPVPWATMQDWARAIAALPPDPQDLARLGVDIIPGWAQFQPGHPLTLQVQTHPNQSPRRCTSRRVLLALPPQNPCPATDLPCHPATAIAAFPTLPPSAIVLGGDPTAIALAQLLATNGTAVTLVSSTDLLLPQEDPSLSRWLTTHCQRLGITLITSDPQAITPHPNGIQVTLTIGEPLSAAALFLGHGPFPWPPAESPPWQQLHLQAVGLAHPDGLLGVNRFLQTPHPRIYACGPRLGGYDLPELAGIEARTAVANALFWPRRPMAYEPHPYYLDLLPPLLHLGLTELQARRRHSTALQVYEQPWGDRGSHWRRSLAGVVKLLVVRGRWVGIHAIGDGARAIAASLALAPPGALAPLLHNLIPPDSPLTALQELARQWEQQRWQPGHWRRDWAENWCHFWRSRRP